MMQKFALIISLLLLSAPLLAQDKPETFIIKSEVTIEYNPEFTTKQQARQKALHKAKVKALEDAFGQVVIQGNATYVKNTGTGQEAETETVFNMIGESMVNGEIIELKKADYEWVQRKEQVGGSREKKTFYYVTCDFKALAREIPPNTVDYEAFALSGDTKNNRTEMFYAGDDMYFYFRSPVSGYLSVFVDITGTGVTQRLIPYQTVPLDYENGLPVQADKEYIFFSAKHNYYPDKPVIVDEIYAAPDEEHEVWRFFVVFSTVPINKPMLKDGEPQEGETEKAELPRQLSSEDFQRWKIRMQSRRTDMQVKTLDVTVTKP